MLVLSTKSIRFTIAMLGVWCITASSLFGQFLCSTSCRMVECFYAPDLSDWCFMYLEPNCLPTVYSNTPVGGGGDSCVATGWPEPLLGGTNCSVNCTTPPIGENRLEGTGCDMYETALMAWDEESNCAWRT